jgi:hypothetical protein
MRCAKSRIRARESEVVSRRDKAGVHYDAGMSRCTLPKLFATQRAVILTPRTSEGSEKRYVQLAVETQQPARVHTIVSATPR